MAILSKNSKLGYKETASGTTYNNLPDLQSIGEIFGDAEQVDVTTLASTRRQYIAGLSDTSALECKFLFVNSAATDSFRVLKAKEGVTLWFQIELADGTKIAFAGQVSVKIDEVAVGEPITFTATIAVGGEMTVTNPTTPST